MTIDELFTRINYRVEEYKQTNPAICERYGSEAGTMFKDYKNGQQRPAIEFCRHWLPWLIQNGAVTLIELDQLKDTDKWLLGIITTEMDRVTEGRYVILGGRVNAFGNAKVFAYQDAEVNLADEASAHLYNSTKAFVKSGWVFAYHDSSVSVSGRAIVEAWDRAFVDIKGDCLLYRNDQARVVQSPNSAVLETK
jgi:hypothetical protein